jgi:hypothetical protein
MPKMKPITIFRGDDTDFRGNKTIEIILNVDFDLSGITAKFVLYDFEKEFSNYEVQMKKLRIVIDHETTKKFPLGSAFGSVILTDNTGKIKHLATNIPFEVTNKVVYPCFEGDEEVPVGTLTRVAWSDIGNTPTTLEGYGITDAVKSVNGVKPDAEGNVVIPVGGGEGGTTDYDELTNKPSINGVELTGDKKEFELGLSSYYPPDNPRFGIPDEYDVWITIDGKRYATLPEENSVMYEYPQEVRSKIRNSMKGIHFGTRTIGCLDGMFYAIRLEEFTALASMLTFGDNCFDSLFNDGALRVEFPNATTINNAPRFSESNLKKIILSDELFERACDKEDPIHSLWWFDYSALPVSMKDGNPYEGAIYFIDAMYTKYLGIRDSSWGDIRVRDLSKNTNPTMPSPFEKTFGPNYLELQPGNVFNLFDGSSLSEYTIEISGIVLSQFSKYNALLFSSDGSANTVLYAETGSGCWTWKTGNAIQSLRPQAFPRRNGSLVIRMAGGITSIMFMDTAIGSSFKFNSSSFGSIQLGSNNQDFLASICISSLRIYDRALSDDEIKSHYEADRKRFNFNDTSAIDGNESVSQHLQVLSDEGEAFTLKATRNEQGEATLVVE